LSEKCQRTVVVDPEDKAVDEDADADAGPDGDVDAPAERLVTGDVIVAGRLSTAYESLRRRRDPTAAGDDERRRAFSASILVFWTRSRMDCSFASVACQDSASLQSHRQKLFHASTINTSHPTTEI
jgi:hypothetical protein